MVNAIRMMASASAKLDIQVPSVSSILDALQIHLTQLRPIGGLYGTSLDGLRVRVGSCFTLSGEALAMHFPASIQGAAQLHARANLMFTSPTTAITT